MGNKKISSQDFLDLMDAQESQTTKPTFQPPKKRKPAKEKPRLKFGRFKLNPVQDELLRFVLTKTPVVSRFASPENVQDWANQVDETVSRVTTKIRDMRNKITRGK